MKKCLLFIVLIILFVSATNAQDAYYDAVQLKKYAVINTEDILPEQWDTIAGILKNYLTLTQIVDSNARRTVLNFKKSNPFFNPYFNIDTSGSGESENPITFSSKSLLSSIGNLNVTPFADGLAKFLVKRAKQELYVSFISQLQDSTKFPELKILFPHTKTLLDNFDSWQYANIVNTLREAFDKDFKELLADIPKLSELNEANCNCKGKVQERVQAIHDFFASESGRIISSALIIGNGFVAESNAPGIIHEIAGSLYLGGSKNDTLKNAVKLLDILSSSVKSTESGKSYIEKDTFLNAMKDSVTRNIFLGLIYQQIKNDSIRLGTDFLTKFFTLGNVNGATTFFADLLTEGKNFELSIGKLSAAKKQGESDLTSYWDAIFVSAKSFLQKATNTQTINSNLKFPDNVQNVFNLSEQTLAIAHDIAVRNYSAVVVGVLSFVTNANSSKDSTASVFKQFFVKYGSFAANMVQAKNSDDFEAAIESVALPVGSASIKKKTAFNIALNGYLGGFFGNEYLKASPGSKWSPIAGVYAPVGVTISKGLGKAGSVSAFVSIIDVGAFASYRLKDDSTKTLPEVSLKNILAPGLGIVYGIPCIPVSVGYTYQLGPQLRELTSSGKNASEKLNRRWQFFLAVDIPILNFYTSSKNNLHYRKF